MLDYSSDNWTMYQSGKTNIEQAEMKFRITVTGFTLLEFKRDRDTEPFKRLQSE
jgi:hypothetical protein